MSDWPFNSDLPRHQWTQIEADGFDTTIPGIIYSGSRLDGGIPLGGLGTGYFTLEGTGKVGHCSIYNDIVPPRLDNTEWLSIKVDKTILPLSTADIAYWGHYPVADLVATFNHTPLSVGLRAWSPFILGDAANSNIPAAAFEINLVNQGSNPIQVELHIAPPAPPDSRLGQVALKGSDLSTKSVGNGLRATTSVALAAGASKRIRFVFAWYFPNWRDSSREPHVHRYSQRYADAQEVASYILTHYDDLLKRILGWQHVIYNADLPNWLRDGLVQSLYSLTKNTVWIARTRKDEWWGENGWFTHNESHTGCPITETMVCRMHGHFPTLFFFPELEASTLDAFRHFQISDGEIPFSYGMHTSMRDPRYHCQHPLNSGQYAQMVYRLFLRTGDRSQLETFYPSAKQAIRYQYLLDDDDDGLVNDQAHVLPGEHWPANQFYDIWPWWGTSAYVAGTWLGTLACGKAMALTLGDSEFAVECEKRLQRGQKAYDAKLWTGEFYRLWNDDESGTTSDVSLGNQLMGQWCVKTVGLENVLPEDKVQSALSTIERLNMQATAYGLVNGVTPGGERYDAGYVTEGDHAKHIFVGENLCAAMTFLYHDHHETGLDVAKRIYEALALKSCSPWNQRCLIHAETGLPVWGHDYYSNLVIWVLPMAIACNNIREFSASAGLIDHILAAAAPRSAYIG
jgi:uncharacterized protein (DUF608 family)